MYRDVTVRTYINVKKIMSWANMAVTMYDVAQQAQLIMAGEANILGLAVALAKGMLTQALLNCVLTAALGEAAATVIKLLGVAQDAGSFIDAVKSGDPEKIIVESVRLAVSFFTLKCQCFTGDTLVSTEDGSRRIDDIQVGDKIWAYNTETGERELKEVLSIPVTKTDIIAHVELTNGEEIQTTMLHPFYVQNDKDGTWVGASNLTKGDQLLMEDGESVYVEAVRVEKLANEINVYNLEIADLHTYYVAGGVLVHNVCTPQEMNKKKAEALEGRDIEFRKLDDALYFIAKKFPGFNEETAGHRSAEGWHFDKHPIGDSIEDIVHINLYSKVYKFRIHITWLD